MTDKERRREALMIALAELIGEENTATLMQALPPFDWSALATRDDIVRLEGRIDRLEGRITGLEGRFDGLEGRITGLEGRITGLEGRITGLEARFDGMAQQFEGLEGHVMTLERSVERQFVATTHRLDTMELALRAEIRELSIETAGRFESSAHALREDLHEALARHTRALGFFTASTIVAVTGLVLGVQFI